MALLLIYTEAIQQTAQKTAVYIDNTDLSRTEG
jgi:hypothetical protein